MVTLWLLLSSSKPLIRPNNTNTAELFDMRTRTPVLLGVWNDDIFEIATAITGDSKFQHYDLILLSLVTMELLILEIPIKMYLDDFCFHSGINDSVLHYNIKRIYTKIYFMRNDASNVIATYCQFSRLCILEIRCLNINKNRKPSMSSVFPVNLTLPFGFLVWFHMISQKVRYATAITSGNYKNGRQRFDLTG